MLLPEDLTLACSQMLRTCSSEKLQHRENDMKLYHGLALAGRFDSYSISLRLQAFTCPQVMWTWSSWTLAAQT